MAPTAATMIALRTAAKGPELASAKQTSGNMKTAPAGRQQRQECQS